MHRSKKIKIGDVNPHLLCVLCGGYFVDATTIIECLHSFCKTCIIRYLESNKTCPSCDVLIHKTRPRLNIRSDKTLQDIVYKLVPGLYKNEMRRRRAFYSQYPNKDASVSPSEERGDEMAERFIFTENEKISLALEYWMEGRPDGAEFKTIDNKSEKQKQNQVQKTDIRYLQCPGALTIAHLKKFIRLKFELPPRCRIDMYHKKELLPDLYTLLDIACIFSWKRLEPLKLYYSIYENIIKNAKVEETVTSKTMSCAETQTKIEAVDSMLPKSNMASSTNDHKFLTPTATKDWNPVMNKTLNTSKTQSKVWNQTLSNQIGQPQSATSVVTSQQSTVKVSSKPLVQQDISKSLVKTTTQQQIKPAATKTVSLKTTVVKTPKQNQKSTLKRLSYQPAKIAPKVQTSPGPNRILNQHLDKSKAALSPTSSPNTTPSPVQTVRLLVNNKTVLNQVTSAVPVKVTQTPNTVQNSNIGETTKNANSLSVPKSSQLNGTQKSVTIVSASNSKAASINVSQPKSADIQLSQTNNAEITKHTTMATVSSVVQSQTVQAATSAKALESVSKPVNVSKQSKCVASKPVLAGMGNGNGPLKVNMKDLSSVPEGAVIRSIRPNDTMMFNRQGSNSANIPTVKTTQSSEKLPENSVPKCTEKLPVNGRAIHPMPNVTGMAAPNSVKTNGRPTTPKPNSASRPNAPQVNANARSASETRPSTPKLNNNGSRPSTPKINGTSRPSTPVCNGGENKAFKPIAPKPILPKEDVRISPPSVNPDLRLSMAYNKVQAEKRPIPTIDSSSSDICEEIRQRKLARMDEPLNLVKRDQEKKKSLSPVNGNTSPNVSPRSNPMPISVGSMTGV